MIAPLTKNGGKRYCPNCGYDLGEDEPPSNAQEVGNNEEPAEREPGCTDSDFTYRSSDWRSNASLPPTMEMGVQTDGGVEAISASQVQVLT